MDINETIMAEAERILHEASVDLTYPRPDECLMCFVYRQLEDFGCDHTLRFAVRYRDLVAPRATGLELRLGRTGGFCDCEIFLNGYTLVADLWLPEREVERDGYVEVIDREPPNELPACRSARQTSTQPCGIWQRQCRGW